MKQIFIFFVAAICCMNAWAEDFSWEGIYYRILSEKNKKVEVTFFGDSYDDHREYSGTVDIPEETYYCGDYYRVTSIGEYAFSGCTSLRSVTIPNSVTNIANSAFTGCTGLSSVTIGNGITQIGSALFRGCTSLHSITIPNSVTSIGEYAFSGCTSLRSVTIPNSVTSIGRHAFFGCSGLTSVTIPESVTSIGESAFEDCSSLPSVTIPNGVTCIKDGTFMGCTSLKLVTIGNSVTSIENKAFNCCGLTSVTIPNRVTSIGDEVFRGCAGLSSVTIGNSITSIGKDAFTACSSLKSVVWNAKTISNFALTDDYYHDLPPFHSICSQITSFTFGEEVKRIPAYLCYEMSNLKSVTIPNSVTSIGNAAFWGCSSLTSVTIPNSVTSIGDRAFYGCYGLTSITIPNSIESIKDGTFMRCTSLKSVTIGNSITSIGYRAFEGCKSLTSVEIPNNVKMIGEEAFYYCSSLTSVTIPNSVTSIGDRAFRSCSRLTSVTIGNSVKEIGNGAFCCEGLQKITCNAVIPPVVSENVFCVHPPIYVPKEAVAAYNAAPVWKELDIRCEDNEESNPENTDSSKMVLDFKNNSKTMYYIHQLGLKELQISNFDGEYSVSFDILNIDQVMGGEFDMTNMWEEQTFLIHRNSPVKFAEFGGKIWQENDTTYLTASILGFDSIQYEISMFYTIPIPTETVTYTFDGLGNDEVDFTNAVVSSGIFVLDAMSADGLMMAKVNVERIEDGTLAGTYYNDGNFDHSDFYPVDTWVTVWNAATKQYDEYFVQKGTMTVKVENNIITAVASFICDNSVQYDLTFKTEYARERIPWDEEEEELDYTFESNSLVEVTDWRPEGYRIIELFMVAADESIAADFYFVLDQDVAADPDITLPAGVYPINASWVSGTTLACSGILPDGSPAPSYVCCGDEEGYLDHDGLYCLVDGKITIEKVDGKMQLTVDALNSYDVSVSLMIICDISITNSTSIILSNDNTKEKNGKIIRNSQLVIVRNGLEYNLMGVTL